MPSRKDPNLSAEKHQTGVVVDLIASQESTDLTRWRLLDERGRQTWHYLVTDEAVKAWPQTVIDRYHLGLSLVEPPIFPPSAPGVQTYRLTMRE